MTLRQLRERAGLTQDQVAKLAELSQTTVSAVELGKNSNVGLDTIRSLARAYGCEIPEVIAALEESVQEAIA